MFQRKSIFILLSFLIGIILALSSQFIWKSQSPTNQSADSLVCMGADSASAPDSTQSCGLPEPPIITTQGFPFGYIKTVNLVTYAGCDGACAQAPSSTTKTNQFSIIAFVESSLTWSLAVCVVLIASRLLSKRTFHRA